MIIMKGASIILIDICTNINLFWDRVQDVLGAPTFKRELYRSKLHPPGRLPDFGCATGHTADAFSEFEYFGVDLAPNAIADGCRILRALSQTTELDLH
jgi:hypothetical protein